ncbi:MAG TPA: GNAT family protein [Anaerolineales bacterium]|nr:GNAT family protein [Anaerolineales bacterium]
MQVLFESERLKFRLFYQDDLDVFFAYRSDPDVSRLQGWPEPYTYEMAEKSLAEIIAVEPGTPGEWLQIALVEKSTGTMIGDIAYKILSGDETQVEIGLTLARPYQRTGYGIEACTRLLTYLFSELNKRRVIACTDVLNTPACSVLEKLGFRREAHFVENIWYKGRWASEYWYGMLQSEWSRRAVLNNR